VFCVGQVEKENKSVFVSRSRDQGKDKEIKRDKGKESGKRGCGKTLH
jgi:hypothetical protein